MEISWRHCPRCTRQAAATVSARSLADATIFAEPDAPHSDRTYVMTPEQALAALAPAARLVGLSGPVANQEVKIAAGVTRIGKAPVERSGEHRMPIAADRYMSRDHACIEFENGQAILLDGGSTNGSYVNGRRVQRAALQSGDRVQLGESIFRFELSR